MPFWDGTSIVKSRENSNNNFTITLEYKFNQFINFTISCRKSLNTLAHLMHLTKDSHSWRSLTTPNRGFPFKFFWVLFRLLRVTLQENLEIIIQLCLKIRLLICSVFWKWERLIFIKSLTALLTRSLAHEFIPNSNIVYMFVQLLWGSSFYFSLNLAFL